ncbi:MAG: phage holin family protein [Pseudomonadales bacterium]|nr:phage holin family protein [Pseudomonadales bacterium]MCP5183713.1 phage holin family protein [Pseudomonadales bacterium]
MVSFLIRCIVTGLGLWLADALLDGIHIDSSRTLILAAVILGLLNAVVRPVLFVLTLPLTVVTLGIFILVLNAAMFGLAAAFLNGFQVAGFWSALAGTLLVSLTSWLASWFIRPGGRYAIVIERR